MQLQYVEHTHGGPKMLRCKHMHATVSRIKPSTLKNNLLSVSCITKLALFPSHSHLQYLIAYSMQIRRGEAWEI